MRHLGNLTLSYTSPLFQKIKVIKDLFPSKIDTLDRSNNKQMNVPQCIEEELQYAVAKLKTGKAPGPNQITSEAFKIQANTIPDTLLKVLNYILTHQMFSPE